MKLRNTSIVAGVFLMLGILFSGAFSPGAVRADCADGNAVPPFLAGGHILPNLLLVIDNSASMYDMAYVSADEDSYCHDDTYDPAQAYEGYFDRNAYYLYSFVDGEFQPVPGATEMADICAKDLPSRFIGSDLCIYFADNEQTSVTRFGGRGNVLNWAAASKFDVEKEILTGGKYDAVNQRLVMESRGCLDNQFVREVAVENSTGAFQATLGIRRAAPGYTTLIDVYAVTEEGFNNDVCQAAVEEFENGNLGQAKLLIDDCMSYYDPTGKDPLAAYKASYNHAVQGCWFMKEHGWAIPGAGDVSRAENDCTNVYGNLREEDPAWPGPATIVFSDAEHVCSGNFATGEGYVGRCWDPAQAVYWRNGLWTEVGWDDDPAARAACIEQALLDYCNALRIPEVPDPSDEIGYTGEFWNIPAMLIEAGVLNQLLDPKATLNGLVARADAPTGLLQQYEGRIRMGAMVFNDFGSATECVAVDPHVDYYCDDPADQDGGKVIAEIGAAPVADLVAAVNGIQGRTWTPFAEAFFNAVGYYTQNPIMRLDLADFPIGPGHDPIQAWCQNNNMLLITDGASTTDVNAQVVTFVGEPGHNDGDGDDVVSCDALMGSTLLDDLTYYGWQGVGIYPEEPWEGQNKENIMTHIVQAGGARLNLSGECNPTTLLEDASANGGTTLYHADDMADLGDALEGIFEYIATKLSSGSASSVISASRGGEGALYQAIFWPRMDVHPTEDLGEVSWLGEVHALLINAYGEMFEDTNADRTLDPADLRVILYFDPVVEETRACFGAILPDGTCGGVSKTLGEVRYLWSASEWLNSVADPDILSQRGAHVSSEAKRKIFTWNDLNNDGIVDALEVLPFVEQDWAALAVAATRGPVPLDFGVQTSAEVNAVVRWIRGQDQAGMRSRGLMADVDKNGTRETMVTWRLADVIHSTPMAVAAPAENYDFLYRDRTYAAFARQYKDRRQVVYFGGNDGMLHAVNGGFYDPATNKFCRTPDCLAEDTGPQLGAELWAYVPYNLTPHLRCLADPAYAHKYFVDLRPRIFDAQIFNPDAVHPHGWGTILVGGMRFGGFPVRPGELDLDEDGAADFPLDSRVLASSYFIFDVTDPEQAPVLLGELTQTTGGGEVDLGYTTAISTMVPMNDGVSTLWYLILGSGPTTLEGESVQRGRVCALPMSWMTAAPRTAPRIPDAAPAAPGEGGCFELPDDDSFVSDLITVDFDLDPNYMADVVYFGTISGTTGNWGGKMYRLVTRKEDGGGVQLRTAPSEWGALLAGAGKANPLPLLDCGQPVTGAAAAGWDGANFWVYFGTGRFYDPDDKLDASQQSYYGIKEPQDCDGNLTWETVEKAGVPASVPGAQGLLRVDQIEVQANPFPADATLVCEDGTTGCLPAGVAVFEELVDYIVGVDCAAGETGTDGWYRDFARLRERNLGQATLLGGLLAFTTYQPFNDPCIPSGLSYLYALYFQTGTAWHEAVFGDGGVDESGYVVGEVELGQGLSTTPNLHVGKQEGGKAFVQTSTGTILEIPFPNLPLDNAHSGQISWHEVRD